MASFAMQPDIIEKAKAFHRVNTDAELAGLIGASLPSLTRAKAGKFVPSVAAGLVRSLGLGMEAVIRVEDATAPAEDEAVAS